MLLHCSIGSVYTFSLFVKPISEYIGKSQGAVQFAFSLAIFFLGMSAAFCGKIVERDIHKSSLISCVCFCAGLMCTAFAIHAKSLFMLYLGYGTLMGIGLGIGYICPVKTLMLWFMDKRGLATGISVCAFGFASAIASPIITFLLARVSLTSTFMTLALMYFFPMIISHFLLKKPKWYTEEVRDNGFKVSSMWGDKKFRLVWFIIFINISCGLALISTASPIMAEKNISPKTIAIIVSIMGIFNGSGRLIFSALSDKMKNRTDIYFVILGLSTIISIATAKFSSVNGLTYAALIIISSCYGAGFSCLPSLLSDIYGMDNISKIHGLSLSAWGIAGLVGNQISNVVFRCFDSYENVFYVLFALYYLAAWSVLRLRRLHKTIE